MKNNKQAGKGSKPRPTKLSQFEKNYDAIDWHNNKKKDKTNDKRTN
jgi:hypothetical protein